MAYKKRIKLIIVTEDSISTSEVKAPNVTNAMIDAAWDLVYTLMTNKRRKTSLYTKDQKKKERAAARKPKKLTKPTKRTRRSSRKPGRGNADGMGIHSMVEGNRDDHQT